jgi:group II intron reverse transcriptase/maturase
MAKGNRYPDGTERKVREMRTAETILNIIQDRGKRGLPLYDVYRQLFNPDLYLRGYARIQENTGAMTPGTTDETVDGMSRTKIDDIIKALRHERWRWTSVRRVNIPKSNGKTRPLGIPTWSDKLLQEVIRSILEAYYDPQFSEHSHGFRPKRGCHTALNEVHKTWRGTTWFIEGDIKGCFDNIDHTTLMAILRENIHDNRFLRLLEGLLKAGYCEEWTYHPTHSGTPQGGVVSPILANIYLDRLDQFVERTLIPECTRGKVRKRHREYKRLNELVAYYRRTGRPETVEHLSREREKYPCMEPADPGYRRLRYIRYADDFLLGFAGPKAEAEEIKARLTTFLGTEINLTLASEKTYVTHARTDRARFLGYEIGIMVSQTKRSVNGGVSLHIPKDVMERKRGRFLRNGTVMHRAELMHDSEYGIIHRYQWEYRGLVEYYAMAQNLSSLAYLRWTMETSLLKTLAHKNRSSVSRIHKRLQATQQTAQGLRKCLKLTVPREGKKPLTAVFGGLSLTRRPYAAIKDQVLQPYIPRRSEIIDRLLRDTCEVCGAKGQVEMHHVRKLADLKGKGQREKPLWKQIMIARHRKTLAVCRTCHMDIQHNRPKSQAKGYRRAG